MSGGRRRWHPAEGADLQGAASAVRAARASPRSCDADDRGRRVSQPAARRHPSPRWSASRCRLPACRRNLARRSSATCRAGRSAGLANSGCRAQAAEGRSLVRKAGGPIRSCGSALAGAGRPGRRTASTQKARSNEGRRTTSHRSERCQPSTTTAGPGSATRRRSAGAVDLARDREREAKLVLGARPPRRSTPSHSPNETARLPSKRSGRQSRDTSERRTTRVPARNDFVEMKSTIVVLRPSRLN